MAVGIFLLSLALRLIHIHETHGVALFRSPAPGVDPDVYWQAARHLLGRAPADPSLEQIACSAPLFVWFLAGAQLLLGDEMLYHRILLAALGALRFPLLWVATSRLTGRPWVSAVAVAGLAAVPSLIHMDTVLLKTSLELTLLSALLLLVARPVGSVGLGLAAGALLSLLFLSQLNTLLYVLPVVAFWLAEPGASWRRRLRTVVPATALFAVVFVGFQARPMLAEGPVHYLPRASLDIYIGWQENATGRYMQVDGIPSFPAGHAFFGRMKEEAAQGRPLSATEADGMYLRRAMSQVAGDPGRAVRLAATKVALFFNRYEVRAEDYLPAVERHSALLRSTPVGWSHLVVLGAIGALALWRRGRRRELMLLGGIILAVLAANVLTMITWRFRLHAAVPLGVLAAAGLGALVDAAARLRHWRRVPLDRTLLGPVAVTVAAALLAAWVAYRPAVSSTEGAMRAAIALERRAVRAEEWARELAELQARESLDHHDRAHVVMLLQRVHRHSEGFVEARALVRETRALFVVNRRYLELLCWLGRYDEARAFVERVRREHPRQFPRLLEGYHPTVQGVIDVFVAPPAPRPTVARR